MKAKKARKRLRQIESMLGTVIERYRSRRRNVNQLLGTAKSALEDVLTNLPKPAKKPPARAAKSRQTGTALTKAAG